MVGVTEKIQEIEREMARTQKNKATEYHLGLLKAKLAKYRSQLLIEASSAKSSGGGAGFDVVRSGDARVALVGFPSVGKSTLLESLTNTESEVAAYEFTTLTCVPGVLEYSGARIQLLDLPGIIEGAHEGRGKGRQVIAVARNSDMVLMLLDATKSDKHQREKLEYELEAVGIRLNKKPPAIYFKKRATGGLSINAMVPLTKCPKSLIQNILHEYKIFNAEVLFREDCSADELIDVVIGNRVYIPCLYVYNKIDAIAIEETIDLVRIARLEDSVVCSCSLQLNFPYVLKKTWQYLDLIRIYTKKKGQQLDLTGALILRNGSQVKHVCLLVHKSMLANFKYALIWGNSVRFSPQRVGIQHVLNDEDVVRIVAK